MSLNDDLLKYCSLSYCNYYCYFLMKRTQNKENYYYLFWIVAMVAFIVPQVYTAVAYTRLADILKDPIEVRVVNK